MNVSELIEKLGNLPAGANVRISETAGHETNGEIGGVDWDGEGSEGTLTVYFTDENPDNAQQESKAA